MASNRKGRREPATLDGVMVKIDRAKFHADCFNRELSRLFPTGTYVVPPEIYDNGRRHVYRAIHPPLPDPAWSAIVGDCLHNLRSALDHLAFQLVRLNGGTPNVHTQFPIFDRPRCRRRFFVKKDCLPAISGGVARPVREVLEVVQPYNRRDLRGGLELLRDLNNIDKHRELMVVVQGVSGHVTNFDPANPPPDSETQWTRRPLVHDEVIAIITYVEPRPGADPNLAFQPRIAFSQRVPNKAIAGQTVDSVLTDLAVLIEDDVLPRFAGFF